MPLIESCETNSMAEKLRDFHLHYHGALNSRYISLTSSMNTRKGSELGSCFCCSTSTGTADASPKATSTHLWPSPHTCAELDTVCGRHFFPSSASHTCSSKTAECFEHTLFCHQTSSENKNSMLVEETGKCERYLQQRQLSVLQIWHTHLHIQAKKNNSLLHTLDGFLIAHRSDGSMERDKCTMQNLRTVVHSPTVSAS